MRAFLRPKAIVVAAVAVIGVVLVVVFWTPIRNAIRHCPDDKTCAFVDALEVQGFDDAFEQTPSAGGLELFYVGRPGQDLVGAVTGPGVHVEPNTSGFGQNNPAEVMVAVGASTLDVWHGCEFGVWRLKPSLYRYGSLSEAQRASIERGDLELIVVSVSCGLDNF